MWQDYVISSAGLIFGFLLMPQIHDVYMGKLTMNKYTVALTTIVAGILCICFYTLNMYFAFFGELFVTFCWFLLWLGVTYIPGKNV